MKLENKLYIKLLKELKNLKEGESKVGRLNNVSLNDVLVIMDYLTNTPYTLSVSTLNPKNPPYNLRIFKE